MPENEPCYECGSTEMMGTACAKCNPDIKDPNFGTEIGTYRIMEDLEGRAKGWPWRYRIEKFVAGGSFLWWKWDPSWQTWRDRLQLDQAQNLMAVFEKGVFESEVVGSRVAGGNRA